ncbi:serine/threonine protein kinase [Oscillatoriales cyanobacterium LEGE 11467]|uniref:non-specific serine/threonine protein kinase n=1 Tax=Zarconia navalis LEGE 11467 TaxID=1828826 RepID=A0A928VZ08_9CYAN|nr:serine/threonine protein kinase [Zarconia navalis LEGE 11467]
MDIEKYVDFLNFLVVEHTGEPLSSVQKAIGRGVLNGMTYKEIKQNDAVARGYSVGYLSRYVAYHLWESLTQVFQKAGVLEAEEKVRSKNLWDCITRVMEREQLTNEAIEMSISPQTDLLDQTLRMRYLITEHLVDGEFSQTYLAEDNDVPDGRLVVIKRLKSNSADTLKRYKREAKVLQGLGKHDRIPELFARFEQDGDFYLVHEFIEGQPLSHELEIGEPWEEARAIDLLRDILEILSFVHQQNIIHRDLHPDNLIRRAADGKIVPIDFGAVKEIGTSQNENTGQATTGVTLGGTSRCYISPEQAYGIPQLCSDIYAVGILCIQALTGVPPRKLKVNRKTGNLSWRKKAPQVCPQFAKILDKMVCYDFRQRYSSATEVLEALDALEPCELRQTA